MGAWNLYGESLTPKGVSYSYGRNLADGTMSCPTILYKVICRNTREPVFTPKPFPPRTWPFGSTPLPLDGSGAGPVAPPPATAIGGAPNVTGAEGSDPTYCEYARQKSD